MCIWNMRLPDGAAEKKACWTAPAASRFLWLRLVVFHTMRYNKYKEFTLQCGPRRDICCYFARFRPFIEHIYSKIHTEGLIV